MDIMIKIAGLAIVAAICVLALRKYTPELALLLTIAALAVVFTLAGTALQSAADLASDIAKFAGMTPEYLAPLLKVLGITIITKLTSDICRDAGSTSLAAVTEITGNVIAIITAVPLMSALLKFVSSI